MDFRDLSMPEAPLIKTHPPGPKSKEYLDYQSLHEGAAVSYPKGMSMALRRAKGATVEDVDGNLYIDFFGGAGSGPCQESENFLPQPRPPDRDRGALFECGPFPSPSCPYRRIGEKRY